MSLDTALKALTEPQDHINELLIIAQDTSGLSGADRNLIREAVEEIERCHKMIVSLQARLIEAQQRQIATNELLLELRAREVKHPFKAMMSGGAQFLLEYRHAQVT